MRVSGGSGGSQVGRRPGARQSLCAGSSELPLRGGTAQVDGGVLGHDGEERGGIPADAAFLGPVGKLDTDPAEMLGGISRFAVVQCRADRVLLHSARAVGHLGVGAERILSGSHEVGQGLAARR